MSNLANAEEGDEISTRVTTHGDQFFASIPDGFCKIVLDDPPDRNSGEEIQVEGEITKKIFAPNGDPKMVFLSVQTIGEARGDEKVGRGEDTDKSSASRGGRRRRGRVGRGEDTDKSLQEIAEQFIGDDELSVTGDNESLVGEAKRTAKNQQRDPAIDPKLEDR